MRTIFYSRRFIFIVYFFLLIFRPGYSQDKIQNRLFIKAAPLALLDIYSGMSPRAGIEWQIKERFGLYAELGTYIPNANGMSNNTGYLSKFEFKKYFNPNHHLEGSYISAEVFFKHQSYGTYDSIALNNSVYQRDYSVQKNVFCLTLKAGTLAEFDSGFILDFFAGVGIRHREITNSLTYDENRFIQQDGSSRINIIKNQAGVFDVLNIDMGIKIGYRIE